ncbi:MAG: chorismate synthase, partial [Oscillospiraceae bacterium]
GVFVGAHIAKLGGIWDKAYDPVNLCSDDFLFIAHGALPVHDKNAEAQMLLKLEAAAHEGDSVGGIIECAALGVPVGVGEPNFDSIESRLSANIFAIPAVKGIEFGEGFSSADLRGSEYNDSFTIIDGKVSTVTNRHGGILGGMATGSPIIFK